MLFGISDGTYDLVFQFYLEKKDGVRIFYGSKNLKYWYSKIHNKRRFHKIYVKNYGRPIHIDDKKIFQLIKPQKVLDPN